MKVVFSQSPNREKLKEMKKIKSGQKFNLKGKKKEKQSLKC